MMMMMIAYMMTFSQHAKQYRCSPLVLDDRGHLSSHAFWAPPNRFPNCLSPWWWGSLIWQCFLGQPNMLFPFYISPSCQGQPIWRCFPYSTKQISLSASVLDWWGHLTGDAIQMSPNRLPFLLQFLMKKISYLARLSKHHNNNPFCLIFDECGHSHCITFQVTLNRFPFLPQLDDNIAYLVTLSRHHQFPFQPQS